MAKRPLYLSNLSVGDNFYFRKNGLVYEYRGYTTCLFAHMYCVVGKRKYYYHRRGDKIVHRVYL